MGFDQQGVVGDESFGSSYAKCGGDFVFTFTKLFFYVGYLHEAGIDVLFDDRPERPGVKFNDMDLIGFPVRVVLGKRGLEAGEVELSLRKDGEKRATPISDMVPAVQAMLEELSS